MENETSRKMTFSTEADPALLAQLREEAAAAAAELIAAAGMRPGQILVVGCSTSEIVGSRIGTDSNLAAATAVFEAIRGAADAAGVFLAAQCCEHLNRAIIVSRAAVPFADPVNVVPQPKAGGSFATAAYKALPDAVAVEHIRADAGLDIGGTLIGMHLREVAVPVRLSRAKIGEANILAARTRPKCIGGSRAVYDPELM